MAVSAKLAFRWAAARAFAVALTEPPQVARATCLGRGRPSCPTVLVSSSETNFSERTSDSKVIARIHRASGMPALVSG